MRRFLWLGIGLAVTIQQGVAESSVWESMVTAEEVQQTVQFYIALTCAYLAILSWFGYLMCQNHSSRVRLEYYLLGNIALGLITTMLKTIDCSIYQLPPIIPIFFDTCKNGLARTVLLMLSAGWGVTVAHLKRPFLIICLSLGILYMILSFTFEMADFANSATPIPFFEAYIHRWVDIHIWFIIFTRLVVTMQYLVQNNQKGKFERYSWLLLIMIYAVVINMAAFIFVILGFASNGNVVVDVLPDLTFFMVLCCVAYLWRPNPNAREYPMQKSWVPRMSAAGNDLIPK